MTAPDPRDFTEPELIGTPLRDAAVDPLPKDFLAPSNAGVAGPNGNPHGPTVVSPGIHGNEGVRGIVPGPVDDDPDAQELDELAGLHEDQPQTNLEA